MTQISFKDVIHTAPSMNLWITSLNDWCKGSLVQFPVFSVDIQTPRAEWIGGEWMTSATLVQGVPGSIPRIGNLNPYT